MAVAAKRSRGVEGSCKQCGKHLRVSAYESFIYIFLYFSFFSAAEAGKGNNRCVRQLKKTVEGVETKGEEGREIV